MDVGRYLVEAHLREGRSIAELGRVHGVHRSWLYKLLGRYRRDGDAGLAPRSRRPHRSPTALSLEVAEEIVRLRTDLLAQGLDAGALTIQWHLERRLRRAPSVSSIIRVLRRRGLVVPEPHKRPRSSFIRFEAQLPNQLWQTDATHWALADESPVEILNIVDDHSRVLVAAVPLRTVKAADVVAVFHQAAARAGYPGALLSDNAAVFSGASRHGKVLLETELERLGIVCKHAAPYHPQTTGRDAGGARGAAGPLPPQLQPAPTAPRPRTAHTAGGVRREGEGRTRVGHATGSLPGALRHGRPTRQGHPALRLAPAPHRPGRAPPSSRSCSSLPTVTSGS